ncbi:MAG: hypothetical protein ACI9BF_000531 [Candidatus Paceibacteria bacterium]|jgi:hypothetical protein
MTFLLTGRTKLLEQYTPEKCPDPLFREKMSKQVIAITTGDNLCFVWLTLSEQDKQIYGSLENHPEGTELCIDHWIRSKAAESWSEEYR